MWTPIRVTNPATGAELACVPDLGPDAARQAIDRATLHSLIFWGPPGTGKTSLAMNIAEHVAVDLKLPVGVFSLEMTAESLVLRMLCSRARVNLRSIRDGFMVERDFAKLTDAAGRMTSAPLFIDDTAGLSILQLRARARRSGSRPGDHV